MPVGAAIGIGTVGSAVIGSNAASKSAKASQKATDQTVAEQRRQFDLTRSDQMPWLEAGKGALGQLQALNSGDFSKFYQSPDYQFALDEGFKSLDRSAASRGRLYSGGYGQDLTKYGQGLATQNYGNYYGRLASLAGVGQSTATNLGEMGMNMASNIGKAYQTNAANRASAYGAQASAWQDGINGLAGLGGYGAANNWNYTGLWKS